VNFDHFSLLVVNAATAVMLGLSIPASIDIWPWLRRRGHWTVLALFALGWVVAIALGSMLEFPHNLEARRLVNGVACLYVAVILYLEDRLRNEHNASH
jgi:uncharacterized membrane protein YfcA